MSTSRGNSFRTRAQKHQNQKAFKNDLHDTSNKMKIINSIKIAEVCGRCVKIIDWKRQYRKYKPLTQPKICNLCHKKSIKQAYHVICTSCVVKTKKCAKCLVSADEANIIPPIKTKEEELKQRVDLDQRLKTLSERKRRTFLRFLKQGSENKSQHRDTTGSQRTYSNVEISTIFEELKLANKGIENEIKLLQDLEQISTGSDESDDHTHTQ